MISTYNLAPVKNSQTYLYRVQRTLTAQISELEKRIEEFENKITDLELENERLNQENSLKARALSENAAKLQSQEEKLFVLIEENYKLGGILTKAEGELAILRSENQNGRRSRSRSPPQNQRESVADDVNSEANEGIRFRNEREDVQSLIDNLTRKISSQGMTIARLENKIKYLETGNR